MNRVLNRSVKKNPELLTQDFFLLKTIFRMLYLVFAIDFAFSS
jgi:hypothetical protein